MEFQRRPTQAVAWMFSSKKLAQIREASHPSQDFAIQSDTSSEAIKVMQSAAKQSWADLSEAPDESMPPIKGIIKQPSRTLPPDDPPSKSRIYSVGIYGVSVMINSLHILREHCRTTRPDWLGIIGDWNLPFSSISASYWLWD